MNDLAVAYSKVEQNDYCGFWNPVKRADSFHDDQLYRIWKSLRGLIRERSLLDKIDPQVYKERLKEAWEFIDFLQMALSEEPHPENVPTNATYDQTHRLEVWTHKELYRFHKCLNPEQYHANISSRSPRTNDLPYFTAQYLERPWMQHNEIDWILIDSMLWGEIAGLCERLALN